LSRKKQRDGTISLKLFHCDYCGELVYFENSKCLECGHLLAYLPDAEKMSALEPANGELWSSVCAVGDDNCVIQSYRLCQNYTEHNVCNWAVSVDDPNPLCLSCRLTSIVPDLSVAGNKESWYKIEVAKRRMIYNLMSLNLPITSRVDDPDRGLSFSFLADGVETHGSRILTGHTGGIIVLNLSEADDVERERTRLSMHEPYRTLLGHFRHEIGHYYWDVLIRDSVRIDDFRDLFGDERIDYLGALDRYYNRDVTAPVGDRFISVYASSHPWEDWAECWANYLHMSGTLETADALGLQTSTVAPLEFALDASGDEFMAMLDRWLRLTFLLNNLNRSLGLHDVYPFRVNGEIAAKLRFIHDTIVQSAASTTERTAMAA
jgi:hypothetical protein